MLEIIVLLVVAAIPLIIVVGLFGYLWTQLKEIEPWEPDQFDYENSANDFLTEAPSSIGKDTTLSR